MTILVTAILFLVMNMVILIDIHSYTFDENGVNIFGVEYQPHQLIGIGFINGYKVNCVPPDVLVEFHTGYEVDENDYHDVKALCNRFNIALPKVYESSHEQKGLITQNW